MSKYTFDRLGLYMDSEPPRIPAKLLEVADAAVAWSSNQKRGTARLRAAVAALAAGG